MFLIALDWQLDSKGYELADAGERYGQVIVRNGGKWIATQPLAGKVDILEGDEIPPAASEISASASPACRR